MRRLLPRLAIACAAFLIGTLAGSVHQQLVTQRPVNVDLPAPSAPPPPPITPPASNEQNYPENTDINPGAIEYFIEQYPYANLTRLWERLGIRNDDGSFEWGCNNVHAQAFDYNLDDDLDKEVVLWIGDRMCESYRYLIFKERAFNDTELLGHIEVRGKYRPSTHAVLLSGGKSWLVIEGQVASGSGLAVYGHTIYQVTSRGVKPVLNYYNEIHQSGYPLGPTRLIVARPVSIEVKDGRVKCTVSYIVEYSGHDAPSLFKKQQTAVLVGSYRSTRLDASASTITPHEFDTVFNFDSMGEEEFLNYNRSELRAIATGRDRMKKQWLKDYLETCEKSRIKRELMSLLR